MSAIKELDAPVPRHLRRSLSRGVAKEAFNAARRDDGDMALLLGTSFSMSRSLNNHARIASRMKRLPGVIRVSKLDDAQS